MAQMNELFLLKKYFGHVETQQDEHITEYKAFLQNLVESADPTDELPVRVPPFRFSSLEIPGAVINWAKQYLEARYGEQNFLIIHSCTQRIIIFHFI